MIGASNVDRRGDNKKHNSRAKMNKRFRRRRGWSIETHRVLNIRVPRTSRSEKFLLRTNHWIDDSISTVGYGLHIGLQDGKGFGLKAMKSFKKGDIVTQYDGYMLTISEAKRVQGDDPQKTHHFKSCGKWVIDGLRDPVTSRGFGGASFANHSVNPNTKYWEDSEQRVFLKALVDIKPGDWLEVDYGKAFINSNISNLK